MKISKQRLKQIIKEEIEQEIEEGFMSDLTSYAKGRMATSKDDMKGMARQNFVAKGRRLKIAKAIPVLINKLQVMSDAIDADNSSVFPRSMRTGPIGKGAFDKDFEALQSLLPSMNEGILDRAKEIGSNIKGDVKGHMARRKDAVTKSIYDARNTINAIKKLAAGEPEVLDALNNIEDKVIAYQKTYSRMGRKTY